MQEGIVKSVKDIIVGNQAPVHTDAQMVDTSAPLNIRSVYSIEGVHPEIYRYYNVVPRTMTPEVRAQLQAISSWAFSDMADVRQAIHKLRDGEKGFGEPAIGETRFSRLFNHIRIGNMFKHKKEEFDDEEREVNGEIKTRVLELEEDKQRAISQHSKALDGELKTMDATIQKLHSESINKVKELKKKRSLQMRQLRQQRKAFGE